MNREKEDMDKYLRKTDVSCVPHVDSFRCSVETAKVCVAVRVRPLIDRERNKEGEPDDINWCVEGNLIQQVDPKTNSRVAGGLPYTFDHVFSMEQTTKEVYDRVVAPIVNQAFSGFNGTIFCYGQTSSGKTYSLYGNDGILFLTSQYLFKRTSEDDNRTYIIRVGLIEIYKEKVTDLLSDNDQNEIQIIECNGSVVPKGLEEIQILEPQDMIEAIQIVQRKRKVGETRMNLESSRSHTILRILISSVPKVPHDGSTEIKVTQSLLNFVDLAGSEKSSHTGTNGERFKEATYINKSLSVLSQVVMQLSDDATTTSQAFLSTQSCSFKAPNSMPSKKASKYVNYRDSKLTRILQSSLSGNAYIAMVCTVTPASVDETISTLRFARTAKKIQTQPTANTLLASDSEYQQNIKKLQHLLQGKSDEVEELKRQLDVFMKFCPSKVSIPQHSTSGLNNIGNYSDRRKTICSLTGFRKDIPFSTGPVNPPIPESASSPPKRLRLDTRVDTPPNSLRHIQSQLRIALEKEAIEKEEIQNFHACEVEIFTEKIKALEKSLCEFEARENMFRTVLKESRGGLENLKALLQVECADGSTQTTPIQTKTFSGNTPAITRKEIGVSVWVGVCDVGTSTPPLPLNEPVKALSNVATETILLHTLECGVQTSDEPIRSSTSTMDTLRLVQTSDVGTGTSKTELKDTCTETYNTSTADCGVNTDDRLMCTVGTVCQFDVSDKGTGMSYAQLVEQGTDADTKATVESGMNTEEQVLLSASDLSTHPHLELAQVGKSTSVVEFIDKGTCTERTHVTTLETGVNTDEPLRVSTATVGTQGGVEVYEMGTGTSHPPLVDTGSDAGTMMTKEAGVNTDEPLRISTATVGTQGGVEAYEVGTGMSCPELVDTGSDAGTMTSVEAGVNTDEPLRISTATVGSQGGVKVYEVGTGMSRPQLVDTGSDAGTIMNIEVGVNTDKPLRISTATVGSQGGVKVYEVGTGMSHPKLVDTGSDAGTMMSVEVGVNTDKPLRISTVTVGSQGGVKVCEIGTVTSHPQLVDTGSDARNMSTVDVRGKAEKSVHVFTPCRKGRHRGVEVSEIGTTTINPRLVDMGSDACKVITVDSGMNTEKPLRISTATVGTHCGVKVSDVGTGTTHRNVVNRGSDSIKVITVESGVNTEMGNQVPTVTVTGVSGQGMSKLGIETTRRQVVDKGTDALSSILPAKTRDFGMYTQETDRQSRASRVNRQAQTDWETGYDGMKDTCRTLRIYCKTYEQKLENVNKALKEALRTHKKNEEEHESKIHLKDTIVLPQLITL